MAHGSLVERVALVARRAAHVQRGVLGIRHTYVHGLYFSGNVQQVLVLVGQDAGQRVRIDGGR